MTMSLNRRALWVVEAILAHLEERRVAVHAIDGGGRYIDCGIRGTRRLDHRDRAGSRLPG